MSFEKMQDTDNQVIHTRACILIYGFTPQELKSLKNIARLTGLNDQVLLSKDTLSTTLLDLLDNKPLQALTDTNVPAYKAIIFNNVPSNRMNAFIESLKKFRIPRPLMATVTETSINWTIKELLENLAAERSALQNNTFPLH